MSVVLLRPDQQPTPSDGQYAHLLRQAEEWQDQAFVNSALLRAERERGDRLAGDVVRLRADNDGLREELYQATAQVRRLKADQRAWWRRMVMRLPKGAMVLGAIVGGFAAVLALKGMGL
jgi:hypothetical protein